MKKLDRSLKPLLRTLGDKVCVKSKRNLKCPHNNYSVGLFLSYAAYNFPSFFFPSRSRNFPLKLAEGVQFIRPLARLLAVQLSLSLRLPFSPSFFPSALSLSLSRDIELVQMKLAIVHPPSAAS